MTDLVERLRNADGRASDTFLCKKAADRIEALERERDERPSKRLWEETSEAMGVLRGRYHEALALLKEARNKLNPQLEGAVELLAAIDALLQQGK